jgi:hypothetical protein
MRIQKKAFPSLFREDKEHVRDFAEIVDLWGRIHANRFLILNW